MHFDSSLSLKRAKYQGEGNVGNSFNRSEDDDDDDTGFRSLTNGIQRRNWYGRFNKRMVVNILVANI